MFTAYVNMNYYHKRYTLNLIYVRPFSLTPFSTPKLGIKYTVEIKVH